MSDLVINLHDRILVAFSEQKHMSDNIEFTVKAGDESFKIQMTPTQRDYLLSRLLYTSEDRIRNVWEALHCGGLTNYSST